MSLFGRLEDQVDGAAEPARFCKVAGRAQEHRGVAVMPAGMGDAVMNAGVRNSGGFANRQRIHVGAQSYRSRRVSRPDDTHHAGFAEPLAHLDPPAAQQTGDDAGGSSLVECNLGMAMDILADSAKFGRHGRNTRKQVDGVHDGWVPVGTARASNIVALS